MILFAAFVGVRPGELYALEREDVQGDEVVIRRSLDGTGQIKRPKNGKERVVILPPPARLALAEVPVWVDVPWVFVTPCGRRFSKGSHLHYWRAVRAAFGRPTMDSTNCAISARLICWSSASLTRTSLCSWVTRTAVR